MANSRLGLSSILVTLLTIELLLGLYLGLSSRVHSTADRGNTARYLEKKAALETALGLPVKGDVLSFDENNYRFLNHYSPKWRDLFEKEMSNAGYEEIVRIYDISHQLGIESPNGLVHLVELKADLYRGGCGDRCVESYSFLLNGENGSNIKSIDLTVYGSYDSK